MKIAFIGVGNMSEAIIEGIKEKDSVYISGRTYESTLVKAKKLGVKAFKNHQACLEKAELIVLGVKPEVLQVVLEEIKEFIGNKTIVSIAAKRDIQWIESIVGHKSIIRVMPNLNVKIAQGVSAICANEFALEEHYLTTKEIFENLGKVVELKEEQFSAFIGIAGSMPAFVFKFIHESALSVMDDGIDYDRAVEVIAATFIGSAHLVQQSDDSLEELIRKVSSPNGTTIEGTKALDQHGFAQAIHQAIQATILKDKKG